MEEIIALADSERTSLGFWPEPALRDAITRKKLFVLLDRTSIPKGLVGFLLFSGVYPHVKIQAIATVETSRRQGGGTALLRGLIDDLEKYGYLTVRADVASDLDTALRFYSSHGFRKIRSRPGGSAREREIIVHRLDLDTASLFSLLGNYRPGIDLGISRRSIGEAPFFALDLNVYFDLARDRSFSREARQLFGAALAHQVRLVIADEFLKELQRTSPDEQNDPILPLAQRLPRMPQPHQDDLLPLRDQFHELIFVVTEESDAGTEQAISDAAHLAHATLARASGFVTRDQAILRARSDIFERFGIDVITVDELLSVVSPDEVPASGWPLFGNAFASAETSADTIREYMVGQTVPQDIVDQFTSSTQTRSSFVYREVTGDETTLACSALIKPEGSSAVGRVFVHSRQYEVDAELYTDHLLDLVLREASAAGATLVELESVAGQSTLKRLAMARGFFQQSPGSAFSKIVVGRPITSTIWRSAMQELRLRTGIQLPLEMPAGDFAESFVIRTSRGATIKMSLGGLEDILGPTLFIRQDRDGVIVPITRDYSQMLLGVGKQMTLGLTPNKDAAFLSTRAYINTPRAANVMRPDIPILFYESQKNDGVGGIVAAGRIVDAIVLNKNQVPRHARRRMVVDDVNSISAGQDVLITSFDNLFGLPYSVPFHVLQRLGAVDASNLVTAKKIPGEQVTKIINRGWKYD